MKTFSIRRLLLAAVVVVIFAGLVSACSPQTTLTGAFFKRNDTYVSAGEIPELMAYFSPEKDGLTVDDTIRLVTDWAAKKYTTSQTSGNGFTEAARFTIPTKKVGVWHIGSHTIILPPRTYTNVPATDDEIAVMDALCVGPGKLAWKYDYAGKRVVKYAQEECYLDSVEGWSFDDALKINQGELAWRLNPNGSTDMKTDVGVYPTEFLSEWTVEKYLVVLPNTTAYRLMPDGSFEFRTPNPGVYPFERDSLWTHAESIQISPNQFGVYLKSDKSIVYLAPGVHFEAVKTFVNIYPADAQRYRTNDKDLYNSNPSPDAPACMSFVCGTIIDKIVISGTARLVEFNADIGFIFEDPATSQAVLDKYAKLGNAASAVQDFVEGPAREAIRISCSDMTQDQLQTEVGKAECQNRVLAKIQARADSENKPIHFTNVKIRSQNFNDSEIRAASAAAEVEVEKQNGNVDAAVAQRKAIEAQNETLKALKEQIAAKTALASQVVDLTDGVSCQELALLSSMGIITIDWEKLPTEMCVSGSTSISVTAPQK